MTFTERHPNVRFVLVFVLLVVAVICAPLLARGEEPRFGGCLESSPETCFAPAVSVNLLSLRLRDGEVMTTFDPGLGYGVTFFSRRWYQTGVAGTLSFPELAGEKRVTPAVTVSFAEYARLGVACPLWTAGGFRENARLLIGFGADFGARW